MPSSHGNSPQIRRPIENFEADPVSALKVGQTVEHDRFGIGTLVAMDGDLANLKAIVDFQDGSADSESVDMAHCLFSYHRWQYWLLVTAHNLTPRAPRLCSRMACNCFTEIYRHLASLSIRPATIKISGSLSLRIKRS